MRNKTGRAAADRDTPLRTRIRSDLEHMGLAPDVSESVADQLESSVAKLSQSDYMAVLGGIAAVYSERTGGSDDTVIRQEDIAEVQRLMQGFSEEVQKLDEGLRMLSAYVSRLRVRGARSAIGNLH